MGRNLQTIPLLQRLRSLWVRRGLPLFLGVVVCLAFWQVRLSWQVREQDRHLEIQRSRERLDQVAALAIAQLSTTLADWELTVRGLNGLPFRGEQKTKLPQGGSFILIGPGFVTAYPPKPLLFVPSTLSVSPPASSAFDVAEQLEFRDQRYERALSALHPLFDQSASRPEALLRMARLERKLGRPDAALAAYDCLSRETGISPSGVPYALLALGARFEMLSGLGPSFESIAAAEAARLRAALLSGRWPLRVETFEYYWAEANRRAHPVLEQPGELTAYAALVSDLCEEWQRDLRSGASSGGRQILPNTSLVIWHADATHLAAMLIGPGWLTPVLKMSTATDVRWSFSAAAGGGSSGPHVFRLLSDAGLSGKLEFWSTGKDAASELTRSLWLAGVVLMLSLVLTGAYATYRAVNRELYVAELQADFVSAVSHEFRSPLTTLRTLSELLAHDRIPDEGRRRRSYGFLERETARLQRLVEDLLDFGRMESGRKQYHFEPHDVFALVRSAVTEFSQDPLAEGYRVEANLLTQPVAVQLDEEAFGRALRNLMENAVKYSPGCKVIWVDGAADEHHAVVSVRDRGMGIARSEQREIFQKFVRGTAAKQSGVKGTGVGLSMVRQIVETMGGQIRLESAVGVGSTFTITVPVANHRERSV